MRRLKIDEAADEGAISVKLPDPKVTSTKAVVTQLSASETAALLRRLEPLADPTAEMAQRQRCARQRPRRRARVAHSRSHLSPQPAKQSATPRSRR